jgi:Domain of unknown function (DUF4278)
MKLSYRGVEYENDPLGIEIIPGEVGGKYRGANWRHNYVRHIPVPSPVANLKYRGVAYQIGKPQDVLVREDKKVADEPRNSHLANICRNLEKRLQVAKVNGDEKLVELLEDEKRQLTYC